MEKRGRPQMNRRPIHITESFRQAKAFEAVIVFGYDGTYSDLVERLLVEHAKEIVKKSPEAVVKYSILFDD